MVDINSLIDYSYPVAIIGAVIYGLIWLIREIIEYIRRNEQ